MSSAKGINGWLILGFVSVLILEHSPTPSIRWMVDSLFLSLLSRVPLPGDNVSLSVLHNLDSGLSETADLYFHFKLSINTCNLCCIVLDLLNCWTKHHLNLSVFDVSWMLVKPFNQSCRSTWTTSSCVQWSSTFYVINHYHWVDKRSLMITVIYS